MNKRSDDILFALLRMALYNKACTEIEWAEVTEQEWKQCYRLSVEQGVMAMAWDGLQQVMEQCNIPRSLKITWGISVQNYEQTYEHHCQTAEELTELYKEHGVGMVQLKGVGFSTYYPIPAHREGGDIDIYTYSNDSQVRSDQEANRLADELMLKRGIKVDTRSHKHSTFKFKGVSVENHKTFLSVQINPVAVPMDKLLRDLLVPVPTDLCEGKYHILTPPPAFNALFLSFHAAQHFGYGFRLHHLVDWACLLNREGFCMPQGVTDERFMSFVCAMTHLCNRLLGTNVQVKGGEELLDALYNQMMRSPYSERIPVKGKIPVVWYKLKRMLYSHKMLGLVFDISLSKRIVHSILFHLKSPGR